LIILDTNVISSLMRRSQDRAILAWLDRQDATAVWTTSITVFEIRFGLHRLPPGKRHSGLVSAFERILGKELGGRVFSFDTEAASEAGRLGALHEASGRTLEIRDLQIAGIVRARSAVLATRNVRHFGGVCPFVDPGADASL